MIHLAPDHLCTACSACYNICNHEAIAMVSNHEGFKYPHIDNSKCIECGLCQKICPVNSSSATKSIINNLKCYAAYSNKYQKNGSSGGMFSAIADYVLKANGYIYGAALTKELQCKHIEVSSKENMQPLRGSKYIQSDLENIFQQIKKRLQENKIVLFTGTPCQVDGLYSFLRHKDYPNLITIDLICHGVPSQRAFDKWIKTIEYKKGKIDGFNFRKLDGWSSPPRYIQKGKSHSLRYDLETYMYAFYEGYLFRESCYHCMYANTIRKGDITLGDFWSIGNYGKPFNKSKRNGISLVFTNTAKGRQIMDNIKGECYIEEREIKEAIYGQHNLKYPSKRPEQRKDSATDFISEMSLLEFGTKYKLLPKNKYLYHLKSFIKDSMIDYGIFDIIKEYYYKFIKK